MIIGKYSGVTYEPQHAPKPQKKAPVAPSKPLCSRCELKPVHALDRCEACYKYLRIHGVDRPWALIERAKNRKDNPRWCVNCGNPELFRLGRCNACCKYFRINKKERPSHLWNDDARCLTCSYPKKAMQRNRHGRRQFIKGKCITCYDYKRKHKKERPKELWGIGVRGWCDCGWPAEHKVDGFSLCNRCVKEYR